MLRRVIVGVCILCLFCILSGCVVDNNNNNLHQDAYVSGDIDKVNVSELKVTTHWEVSEGTSNMSRAFNETGFYHAYPSNAEHVFYRIKTAVLNIADMMLDEVHIKIMLYDDTGMVVEERQDIIIDFIEDKRTQLEVFIEQSEVSAFDDISGVKFQVDVQ